MKLKSLPESPAYSCFFEAENLKLFKELLSWIPSLGICDLPYLKNSKIKLALIDDVFCCCWHCSLDLLCTYSPFWPNQIKQIKKTLLTLKHTNNSVSSLCLTTFERKFQLQTLLLMMSLMAILGWAHPLLRPKTTCKQISFTSFRALAIRVRRISSQQAVWDLSSETSILTTSSMRSFQWDEYPHNKQYEIFPVRRVSSQQAVWDHSSETNILTTSSMRSFQWDEYPHNYLYEIFPVRQVSSQQIVWNVSKADCFVLVLSLSYTCFTHTWHTSFYWRERSHLCASHVMSCLP